MFLYNRVLEKPLEHSDDVIRAKRSPMLGVQLP